MGPPKDRLAAMQANAYFDDDDSFNIPVDEEQEGKCLAPYHRRRMELEDKAKAVASVWWAECVQVLATLAVLFRSI